VVLIRRKSAIQLQQHCDNAEQKKRIAAQADNPIDVHRRQELRNAIRETRNFVTMPAVPTATTVQHPTTGTVPFGMPNPLNPAILHGAMTMQTQQIMQENMEAGRPWHVQRFSTNGNVLDRFTRKT